MLLPISDDDRCRLKHGPGFFLFQGLALRSCEGPAYLIQNCESMLFFGKKNHPRFVFQKTVNFS